MILRGKEAIRVCELQKDDVFMFMNAQHKVIRIYRDKLYYSSRSSNTHKSGFGTNESGSLMKNSLMYVEIISRGSQK